MMRELDWYVSGWVGCWRKRIAVVASVYGDGWDEEGLGIVNVSASKSSGMI